ncbi:MAG: HVO_0416 family zinc finger protein [Halobacteriales archaeon]|nr:HVO_0416 family zinc finger protein [Halobacteriales archaeon]
MASARSDDLFDRFLAQRGHEPEQTWDRSYNKKQCPECGGLHDLAASACSVCGWTATPAQSAD